MTPLDPFAAPWHKVSFDRFLNDRLPALLRERLPISGYAVEFESERLCHLTVDLGAAAGLTFPSLPQPDPEGLFWLNDQPNVVIPVASNEELDKAEVVCAGEQLYDYIAARLGQATAEIEWDKPTARAFLPLDAWWADFLRTAAQPLDVTNWNARTTHLRRLLIPSRTRVVAPGQLGRVDPFETPEGPNIGRVFTVALGAEIRDQRLVITDNSPQGTLGHNAIQVPFIEHCDANRLLMGVNMMRQALAPEEAEPALVQTGFAPAHPGADYWCGRNLLTSFVAWGEASVEDGLVISKSCAQRLNYPYPAEPGDKLANRHGIKGVVSQVLPDDQMPHLADGTPVEIVYSFAGLARRMVLSLVREAVAGRIARAEGSPMIVPPFKAPSTADLQARLAANGLPESGMEHLRRGKDGPALPYTSTAGWVYWYRLDHLARPKLHIVGAYPAQPIVELEHAPHPIYPPWETGQVMGEFELHALLQVGAVEFAREALTSRALRRTGDTSTYFQDLADRLAAAGIMADLQENQVSFRFSSENAVDLLKLARPVFHPWLPEQVVEEVGCPPKSAGASARSAFDALAQVNERLKRWLAAVEPKAADASQSAYLTGLLSQLDARLRSYFEALLPVEALRFGEPQSHSARLVASPAVGLRLDQVGLPGEVMEALFGRQVNGQDASLEGTWVVIYRAPALSPTALIAFHPVRIEGATIRLHPQACALLNVDFDGDQLAVFLPLSQAAQSEVGEKLSVESHLRRDPTLLPALLPTQEGIWGLAALSLTVEGRRQLAELLGVDESRLVSPLTSIDLVRRLAECLSGQGPGEAIRLANALARLGYAACLESGASLAPFPVSQVPLPPAPVSDGPQAWEMYLELSSEAFLSGRDYRNPNLGPQLLSALARPKARQWLLYLVCPAGPIQNAEGQVVVSRRSLAEGRTPAALFATVSGARQGLARIAFESEEILQEKLPSSGAVTVIARARRLKRPGIVFARAALSGEVDPLTDVETRVLVGR
jgi:hypothetical protein